MPGEDAHHGEHPGGQWHGERQARADIDVAMLPAGDNFTMGPDDAVKTVQFLQPTLAVLMHYNAFGLITQDAEAVADAIRQHTSGQQVLLKPGETLMVA